MSSVDVRIYVGIVEMLGSVTGKVRKGKAHRLRLVPPMRTSCLGFFRQVRERCRLAGLRTCSAFARLDQTQFFCTFDSRPATVDVEFAVDALGMGADGAQGDHEFTGDLWPRKLGLK